MLSLRMCRRFTSDQLGFGLNSFGGSGRPGLASRLLDCSVISEQALVCVSALLAPSQMPPGRQQIWEFFVQPEPSRYDLLYGGGPAGESIRAILW